MLALWQVYPLTYGGTDYTAVRTKTTGGTVQLNYRDISSVRACGCQTVWARGIV